ncbi:cyclin-dependent kinase-like Serine/Threonine kinase family protein [Gracilaria domingensis]|nr:cyclin-dependent kinase-like Serine/Threonine kinase family protein [Gracilaria domingensis]
MLGCGWSSLRMEISRIAVDGTPVDKSTSHGKEFIPSRGGQMGVPSSSCSRRIFLRAMRLPVLSSRPL